MTTKLALAVLLGIAFSGCARRVTLDPEVAAARNSKDWTVKSEPSRLAAPPAKQPAAAPEAGARPKKP